MMIRTNPAINTVLPESGSGFRTYNREEGGVDQVGLPETIDLIERIGEDWSHVSDIPFQVGDISRQGGGDFPPHEAHKNGTECDLRPFRKDGAMEPTNINDASYDRDRTRSFILEARQVAPQVSFLFNDQVLIKEGLCSWYKGHHNHLHMKMGSSTQDAQGC